MTFLEKILSVNVSCRNSIEILFNFFSSINAKCCLNIIYNNIWFSKLPPFFIYIFFNRIYIYSFKINNLNFLICLQTLQVYSEDVLLGSISQNCYFLRPTFSINDSTGKTVLRLKGPRFPTCNNIVYKVKILISTYSIYVSV